jgi:hypothetical protein
MWLVLFYWAYNKQYRLKCKLLLQASTSTETELAEKQKKTEYDKQ